MNTDRAERRSLTIHLGTLLEEQAKSKVPVIFIKEITRARKQLRAMCRKMTVQLVAQVNHPLVLGDDEEVI